jgi:N-acetylglutamate synthase-like GNAT family acetyltransferase
MDSTSRVSRREFLLATGGATALLAASGLGMQTLKHLIAPSLGPSDVFDPSSSDLAEINRRLSTVFPAEMVPEPRVDRAIVRWYDGDRVIGSMTLGPVADGDTLVIGTLGFKEAYRQRGIMTAAIAESRDWLRARGIERLRAPVTMAETRGVFARRGFTKTGDGYVLERPLN